MSINSVDELWNRIYDDCRQNERITDVGLKTWIIDLKPTFNEDGSLTPYHKQRIQRRKR